MAPLADHLKASQSASGANTETNKKRSLCLLFLIGERLNIDILQSACARGPCILGFYPSLTQGQLCLSLSLTLSQILKRASTKPQNTLVLRSQLSVYFLLSGVLREVSVDHDI